ncbi:MAG: hypothetical protein EAX86_13685 [Candidatus Heimdallarchaeota archaeon]|nr:hypothetical protein [Candidatus Heimdallarchaeota archaeon]
MHEPIETILERKENELEATIKQVNDRIIQGKNPDIKMKVSGENIHWHLPYRNDDERSSVIRTIATNEYY